MITAKMIIGLSSVLMFLILFILIKYSKALYKRNSDYYPLNGLSKFVGILGTCNFLIALGGDIRMIIAILIATFMLLVTVHRKLGLFHSVLFSVLQVISTPAALIWACIKTFISLTICAIKNRCIYGIDIGGIDPYNPRQSRINKKSIALSNINREGKEMDKKLLKELK